MAVRLREADNIAAMAELQQQISELEIQVKSVKPREPTEENSPLLQKHELRRSFFSSSFRTVLLKPACQSQTSEMGFCYF